MLLLTIAHALQSYAWVSVSHWVNSDPVTLAECTVKVVMVEAFQMLCPGCVSHGLAQASRIRQTFYASEVAVIGIHTVFEHHEAQGSVAALKAFTHEYKLPFPVGIDERSPDQRLPCTMQRYSLGGTPSLMLFDRAGRLVSTWLGHVEDLQVGALIGQLLRENHGG